MWYPLTGFYFKVEVDGIAGTVDNSFKEVGGLSMEVSSDEIKEGGNNLVLQVPGRMKAQNLVLKRGVVPIQSPLMTWVENTIKSDYSSPITLKTIIVKLLNDKGVPLLTWTFKDVRPVKYQVADFDSQKSEVLVETMEFAYSSYTRAYAG